MVRRKMTAMEWVQHKHDYYVSEEETNANKKIFKYKIEGEKVFPIMEKSVLGNLIENDKQTKKRKW